MTEKRNKDRNVPTLRFPEFVDEWLENSLGEIASFSKGKGISKAEITEDGQLECIRYGELYTYYNEVIDEVKSKTNLDRNSLVLSEANDVIIPASGETQLDIATASCVTRSDIALGGDLNIIKTPNNGVFLSYYLNSRKKLEIASLSQGISVVHLYAKQLSTLKISIPSKKEQDKIAGFLALLDQRIKTQNKIIEQLESLIKAIGQYLFKLDRFEFNYIKLGEICEIKKGEQINGSELSESGQYPVINGGIEPSGFHSEYNCKAGTITISEGGNSCGFVRFMTRQFWSGGHCYSLNNINESVQKKYLFYFLKYSESKIMSLRVGSGLPNIQRNAISNFEIHMPNENTQTLIVNVLDAIYNKRESERAILLLVKNQKHYFLNKLFK